MQVGILDFNMANNIISNRDSGELTLAISSIKTKVDHLAGHSNKGLVFMAEQQSWNRLCALLIGHGYLHELSKSLFQLPCCCGLLDGPPWSLLN